MSVSNSTNCARSDFTRRRNCLGLASILILGVGLCAGLVVLFVVGLFALTRPVVDASEQFLALLGQGKIAEAYASTASSLRARQDEASFAAAVNRDDIVRGAADLGVDLDEHITFVIAAMFERAAELDLLPVAGDGGAAEA